LFSPVKISVHAFFFLLPFNDGDFLLVFDLAILKSRVSCLGRGVWQASYSHLVVGLLLLHDNGELFNFFHSTVFEMESVVLREYFPSTRELACA
jgi:hypothetical protein